MMFYDNNRVGPLAMLGIVVVLFVKFIIIALTVWVLCMGYKGLKHIRVNGIKPIAIKIWNGPKGK